ncbi:MAG TPA: SAM-dependent methyltransferase, partial [Lacipirellulaceae bacterium]|nr:SAM-dependent methyltransferase [Lacipirellulaceae bacterium]
MVAAWAAVCGALVVAWGVTAVAQQVDAPAAGAAAEINAAFLDPDLDVAEWVTRFEGESREVFTSRRAILAAMQVQPGEAAADVGAGTGLYTALLAGGGGPRGGGDAGGIAPRFVAHIAERAAAAGLGNVTPVVCTAASVQLPPECVDL